MEVRSGGDRLKPAPTDQAAITSRPGRRCGPRSHQGPGALRSLRALRSPAQGWPARVGPVGRPEGRDWHPGVSTPAGRRSL